MKNTASKRVALVTGANRGIGLEVCRQLAQQNYQVILSSRDEKKGKKAVEMLLQGFSNIDYHQLDISQTQSVETLKEWILTTYGRLDVLINNAAINYDTWQQPLNANLEECKQTVDVNLFGAWRMCQAFIPLMQQNDYGRVVNVSSGSGMLSGMGSETPAYGISKAALNVLTIKLAKELKNSGILINSVCPGWVKTDMGGQHAPRSVEEGAQSILWAATLADDGPSGGFFRDGIKLAW